MKNLIFIFLSLAVMACNQSGTSEKTESGQDTSEKAVLPDSLENQAIYIDVEGMTCTGCETTITEYIKELEGINYVDASHINKKVTVAIDTNLVSISNVKDKITESGYKVVE